MNQNNQFISTVEIAEAMNVSHKAILQKLEGANRRGKHTDGVIEILGRLNFQPSDFFIKSSYINNQNKEMPCYNCTRKGCEFLAHKFNGEKGIQFTATFINRFHDMEQALTESTQQIPQKSDNDMLVDLKLNDLHKRLKKLEKKEADKPKRGTLHRLTPRKDTWYEKNRNRIWRIRYDRNMELKELYHLILEECSKYYDLDEAEQIYRDQKGCKLIYPIDVVEYFPELQDIANQVLDYFEK